MPEKNQTDCTRDSLYHIRTMISVLYVDDEPLLLELGKLFLERNGLFTVDTVTSGQEALRAIGRGRYDAIISDYQMPGMDGIELLKRVRASGNTVPLIIFTGRGREEVVIQALNEGADFYLQKGGEPVSQFAELAHKIHRAVLERQAETRIRDQERRETDIINFLPDATFAIDTKGVVIAWNRAMETMTGVRSDQILGKGDFEYALPFYHERRPILIDLIFNPDPAVEKKYSYVKREGRTLFSEITIPHFNAGKGAVLWFTASPLYNTLGKVVGAIESIREITEWKNAERALNESEKRFRDLSDLLPQGIYETDLEGNLTYGNRIAFEMFGYPGGVLEPGINVFSLIVPDDRERAAMAMQRLITGGSPNGGSYEYTALRSDGTTFPVNIYSSPIYRDGRITGLRGIIIDVTDRKRAEERISESEQNYRLLFENATQGILIAQDRYIVHVNPVMTAILGRPVDELKSRPFLDFIHPDDREMVFDRHVRRMNGENPDTGYSFRVVTGDGQVRWVWISSTRMTWSGRSATLSFVTDMTERKEAEDLLIAANKEYTELLDQIQDVYYRSDRDGRLTKASRSWAVLLGYDALSECLGKNIAESFYRNPEDREMLIRELDRAGKVTNYEIWLRRKDGTPVLVETSSHLKHGLSGEVTGVEGLFRDITERKQQETILVTQLNLGLRLEKIHRLHDTLKACLDAAINVSGLDCGGIYLVDEKTGALDLAVSQNLGEDFIAESAHYPPETFNAGIVGAGKPVYLSYDDMAAFHSPVQDAEGLYSLAVLPIVSGGRSIACLNVSSHTDGEIHQAARIALETVAIQVAAAIERIRVEEALSQSEQRYRNVVEDQTEFITRFLPDGTHVFVNEAYCRYFGMKRENLLGHRFRPSIPEEDREKVRQFFRSLTPDHPVDTIEHRIVMPDGSTRWQKWSDRAIFDPSGVITEYQSVGRDVTLNKETEEALLERERQFRVITENSQDMIEIHTPDTRCLYVSRACRTLFGYDPEEITGQNLTCFLHPDDTGLLTEFRDVLNSGSPVSKVTYRIRHKDGHYTWVESYFSGIYHEKNGGLLEVCGITRDISERKAFEEQLVAANRQYQSLLDNLQDVFYRTDERGRLIWINRLLPGMLGYNGPDELIGKDIAEEFYYDPSDREKILDEIRRNGRISGYEVCFRKKDGTPAVISASSHFWYHPDGTVGGVEGTFRDITEQKRVAEALRESEDKIRTIIDTTREWIWEMDLAGRYTYSNAVIEAILGYRPEEIASSGTFPLIHPDDRETFRELLRSCASGNKGWNDVVIRWRHKDGSYRFLEGTSIPIAGSTGEPSGFRGSDRDITERVAAEIELRQKTKEIDDRNRIISTILDSVPIGIFVIEAPSGKPVVMNPAAVRLLGRGILPGATAEDLSEAYGVYRAGTGSRYPEVELPVIRGMHGESGHADDVEVIRPDGTKVCLEVFGTPFRDGEGRIVASISSFIDITERRQTGETMKRLAQFPAENPQPVIRVGVRGTLLYANYPGQKWLDALRNEPGQDIPPVIMDMISRTIPGGGSLSREVQDRSGSTYEVTAVRPAGEEYVNLYVFDITKRRIAEEATLEANKKINLLTSITRHDVANQVTALRGFAELALEKHPDPETASLITKIDAAGATIGRQIEFTKMYQELGVRAPGWFVVSEVVGNQIPTGVQVSCRCRAEVFADPMIEKVFFNLFDNALRHGRHVTSISVTCKPAGDSLVMYVEDNGAGIPVGLKEKVFLKGFGDNTGFGLFLAREILAITGIAIHEDGVPGKGARFVIEIPEEAWKLPETDGLSDSPGSS